MILNRELLTHIHSILLYPGGIRGRQYLRARFVILLDSVRKVEKFDSLRDSFTYHGACGCKVFSGGGTCIRKPIELLDIEYGLLFRYHHVFCHIPACFPCVSGRVRTRSFSTSSSRMEGGLLSSPERSASFEPPIGPIPRFDRTSSSSTSVSRSVSSSKLPTTVFSSLSCSDPDSIPSFESFSGCKLGPESPFTTSIGQALQRQWLLQ